MNDRHEMEKRQEAEGAVHEVRENASGPGLAARSLCARTTSEVYGVSDLGVIQAMAPPRGTFIHGLSSLDELLERDRQREKDGFPRKIRIGKLVKPGRGAKDKVILVPTTIEEKLIHDSRDEEEQEQGEGGGSGDAQEGEVIGEEPMDGQPGSGAGGAGQGEGGEHELESSAYDLGRILTEKFELPNLREKGKKRSLTRYTYDLTDRNKGFGQVLDKKATLKCILETNIALGRVSDVDAIDTSSLVVSPRDEVYRILSREKDLESQALVFFVRDYSGSMSGNPTEIVVTQHVLIYSWLLFQYEKQVETRFILHDTDAKEVDDFHTYANSSVAGGTRVESAYRMVNEIVERDNLARDYNIYVFHGTDGDDWDTEGSKTVPELRKMLTYANRVGITVASGGGGGMPYTSSVERYIRGSGVLDEHPKFIRMDVVGDGVSEERLIEGIRQLVS
ncbi:MAG: DUF444 family protein [Syntrophobacteraceae bacterium]